MNTKMIEEVVKNVLKRLRLEAGGEDLNKDGKVDDKDWKIARNNAVKKNKEQDLEEYGSDCEEDEEDKPVRESKKTLKHKLKKARRQNDKKEMGRLKQNLNESKTLKEALIQRKSNINSKLMKKWFKNRE